MGFRAWDADEHCEFSLDHTPEYLADMEAWRGEDCRHERLELRRRIIASGAVAYWRQCLRCGDFPGQAVSTKAIPDLSAVPDADAALKPSYAAERRRQYAEIEQKHIRIQKQQGSAWWAQYDEYLRSDEWRARRALVMKRAGGVCEGCGVRSAEQVHHLSYEHVGREFLWELVAVCRVCHELVHQERDAEAAGGGA